MKGPVRFVELCEGRDWLLRKTWWWREVGWNWEVLSSSETYSSASMRDKTAEGVAAQLDVEIRRR